MKKVEFKYSSSIWGVKKTETYLIDFSGKRYSHLTNDKCDDVFEIPDDIAEKLEPFFEKLYLDFPHDDFAFDAPMWTLSIDDKTCTKIASTDMDSRFKNVLKIVEVFKNRSKV